MSKASPLFLAVLMVVSASLYGCTQQKNGASSTKLRDMEARYAKLEEDYRAVQATVETNRKKLIQLEHDKKVLAQEVAELRPVVQERDELRKQLVARTGERDNIQAQLTQFRQDLHGLLGRVDTALNTPGGAAAPVAAVPASRKSE